MNRTESFLKLLGLFVVVFYMSLVRLDWYNIITFRYEF